MDEDTNMTEMEGMETSADMIMPLHLKLSYFSERISAIMEPCVNSIFIPYPRIALKC